MIVHPAPNNPAPSQLPFSQKSIDKKSGSPCTDPRKSISLSTFPLTPKWDLGGEALQEPPPLNFQQSTSTHPTPPNWIGATTIHQNAKEVIENEKLKFKRTSSNCVNKRVVRHLSWS
jgi:hypothetical protein